MTSIWSWLLAAALGAYHGLNPAMGWLFAAALGLQEKRRSAVLAALIPIGLGHLAATGLAVGVLTAAGLVLPVQLVKVVVGLGLAGFGLYRLRWLRHPVRVGFRVGFGDLGLWSFIMASAHGAGLMLAPVALALPPHPGHTPAAPLSAAGLAFVHGLTMFPTAGPTALVVYEWVGVEILRRAWFNTDLLWAFTLVAAGILTVIL